MPLLLNESSSAPTGAHPGVVDAIDASDAPADMYVREIPSGSCSDQLRLPPNGWPAAGMTTIPSPVRAGASRVISSPKAVAVIDS